MGTWRKTFLGIWFQIFDMSSASGYMGATYFQEFGQKDMPVLCQEYMRVARGARGWGFEEVEPWPIEK